MCVHIAVRINRHVLLGVADTHPDGGQAESAAQASDGGATATTRQLGIPLTSW